MKIEAVETINLVFEYPPDERFRYGGGVCPHRLTTLIRVHTDSGLTGIGSILYSPLASLPDCQRPTCPPVTRRRSD